MNETRTCVGCGVEIMPSANERNPRKWCSEACRRRTRYRTDEAHRRYCAEYTAARRSERRATRTPVTYERACALCGETFTSSSSTALYCSATCRYKSHHRTRRARRAGVLREPYTVASIAARDGWKCGLCSGAVDRRLAYPHPGSASIDHRVPLALGGHDTPANVQLAHLGCNLRKGVKVA